MCDRLLTLIRRGEEAAESSGDRSVVIGDCCADEGAEEGTGRGFEKVRGVVRAAAGVCCCDCGRKRGLGGGSCAGTCDAELAADAACCDGSAGVEVEGGGSESAIGTSAGGATIRGGGLVPTCGDGRTGV